MSLVTRKSVFRVCYQVRLKPACSAAGTSYKLEILDIETRDIILSRQRTTKVLIRLRGCTGWSTPLVFAYGINRFSHDVAHIAKMMQTEVHEDEESLTKLHLAVCWYLREHQQLLWSLFGLTVQTITRLQHSYYKTTAKVITRPQHRLLQDCSTGYYKAVAQVITRL